MNRSLFPVLLLLGTAGLGSSAAAQEADATRQSFTFVGGDLTVDVQVDVPGVIRLTRGGAGRVDVVSRAANDGMPSAGLTHRAPHRLSLTALGGEHAEFIIVVPEGVRVRVRLPDRDPSEIFGALQHVATFGWDAPPAGVGDGR